MTQTLINKEIQLGSQDSSSISITVPSSSIPSTANLAKSTKDKEKKKHRRTRRTRRSRSNSDSDFEDKRGSKENNQSIKCFYYTRTGHRASKYKLKKRAKKI